MLFRQHTFIVAALAILVAMANYQVRAEESKDGTMDIVLPVEIDVGNETEDTMAIIVLPVEIDVGNETDDFDFNETGYDDVFADSTNSTDDDYSNSTDSVQDDETQTTMEIDCTCDENSGISCSDPSDEEACVCEDGGDVVCADTPVEAPVAIEEDEPPAPDTKPVDSGACFSSGSMVSIVAVSVACIAAVSM